MAEAVLYHIIGGVIGASIMYFVLWYHARKIDALVPGGLKAWDTYDKDSDHASPTGRKVTE